MFNQIGIIESQFDYDAINFCSAAGITDQTQVLALHYLCLSLKLTGVWDKLDCIYPFIGGTASTHKWNLKDPRDLDAAFRLVFSGTWTHDSNGANPNGTNAYADTYYIPSTELNNTVLGHLSYYSRENTAFSTENVMGCTASAGSSFLLGIRRSNNFRIFALDTSTGTAYRIASDTNSTDGTGYFIGTSSSISTKLFRNGTLATSNTTATANRALSNIKVFIGDTNNAGTASNFTDKQCAFASIGEGLTDEQVTDLWNSVNQ